MRARTLFIVIAFVFGSIVGTVSLPVQVNAVDASGFKAGNIMHDSVMSNYTSMTVTDIQNFLNSKVPVCDTNGSQPLDPGFSTSGVPDYNSDGIIQRWEWGKAKYNQTQFPCLKEYKQGGVSAAKIIYQAGKDYKINPAVLLVLLQKEQGLVTDTWPLNTQYKTATGYGCPDNADCNSKYYGFKNQVRWAARMYRSILNNDPNWYTPYVLGNNQIPWHPDVNRCGYSMVNIINRATQALYNYTPYRPNKAALDAGFGTGNSCSSYGNRNFYLYYTQWFGSTQKIVYTSMKVPRYMKAKQNLAKTSLSTLQTNGTSITKDQVIFFTKSVSLNSKTYLVTQHDDKNKIAYGIPLDNLEEIEAEFTPMPTPRYMRLATDTQKIDPRTKAPTGDLLKRGQDILMTESFVVGGKTYLRSKQDSLNDKRRGIPSDLLQNIEPAAMKTPRYMEVPSGTQFLSLLTLENDGLPTNDATIEYFDSVVSIAGAQYLRTKQDTKDNVMRGVPITTLKNMPVNFQPIDQPHYMKVSKDSRKINIRTGKKDGGVIPAGQDVLITESFVFNGVTYMRTKHDATNNLLRGFPSTVLEEIEIKPMKVPRSMKTTHDLYKVSFDTLEKTGNLIPKGRKIDFDSSIKINGILYLRTAFDTAHSLRRGIPMKYLQEL